ncbi:MAG: hypothetical protein DBY41_05870 [Clostridium sp.]|nr:MAG: hypothetical protein DBY41_05870 [Clostridium sp.]
MKFNRTKNTTRTFIFGILYKSLTILGPFVTRTIIIYKLGNEYLGLSSLFTSVLSILNISELGIGSAIAFCLYKPVAEDDQDTIRALLSLLRKLYKYIGVIIMILGILLLPFLPYFISGTIPPDINIYLLYLLYLFNASASYFGFAYKGTLFTVYQRGDVIHKIQFIVDIVRYGVQMIVLILFSNYYYYTLMLLISTIITTIATQVVSKKYFPHLYPQGEVNNAMKKTIKSKVLYLSAHSLAAQLTNSVDNIVISGSLGLAAIGIYGNYNYITSAVLGMLLIAYQSLTPAIGNSLCSEDRRNNQKLYNGLHFICFWIIAFCSTSIFCLIQPFMKMWVGESNLLSSTVVLMITVFYYSNATRQLLTTYVGAAGLWDKTLIRQILAAIMNLILDVLLVKPFGISGIVFASFFTNAFVSLPMDIYVTYKYILHDKVMIGLKKEVFNFIVTTIVCGVTFFLCGLISNDGIFGLFLKILLCCIVPNVIILIFYYRTDNFRYVRIHLKNLVQK